jgi:hypothetical protein
LKTKTGQKSAGLIADIFLETSRLEDFFKNLPPDLEGWAGLYVKLQVEGIKAPQTVRAVQNDLTKFRNFYLDHHRSNDLRKWLPRTTQRYIDHLQENGQRPKTIQPGFDNGQVICQMDSFCPSGHVSLGRSDKGSQTSGAGSFAV